MASRTQLCRRLARLESAVRTPPTTPHRGAMVRQILNEPGGLDRLADFSEILSLGVTMREFEERQAREQGRPVMAPMQLTLAKAKVER